MRGKVDIRVAIVEDEEIMAKELRRALVLWGEAERKQCDFVVKYYSTGEEFLAAGENFDIIFLDIELESKESGLKTAHEIRERGQQTPIVFLTSHKDKVFFGYKVHALDFLIKPIKQQEINWCMNQIADALCEECYIFQGRESIKIPYTSIYYFEAKLHYIKIVTKNGEQERLGSIKQLKKELPNEFVQCHRSYLVNIRHVCSIGAKTIYLDNGTCVDMSVTYRDDVRRLYLKQLPS